MFTLPGLVALLVDYYLRVHEILPSARSLPVMHTLYLVTAFGMALDVRLGLVRAEPCPQLRLALPLWLWTMVSVVLTGGLIGRELNATTIYMMIFVLLAQGVQSFRGLRFVATSILLVSLFLGVVAIVQAMNPLQCILQVPGLPSDAVGRPDGRPCESALDCREGEELGEDHICERPGPLGTTSIDHGRVRYRGILMDPNELSLVLSIALPFAMAPFAERRSLSRLLLLLTAFAIVLPAVVWTASRTGQLAFVTVLAVYLVQRVGWRGLVAAAVLAAPVLVLGGRSGGAADESALERLEAWNAGFDMLRSSPLWGIGKSQFVEHHVRTAHNTFVLEAAELGLVGLVLWLGVFYTGIKIVLSAMRRYRGREDGGTAYEWARALLATLCAMGVGINFLSLGYHPIVWAFLALPGAYYFAVRRHDEEFRVAFGVRDLLVVTGLAVLYLAAVKAYLVIRGI
jgi:hypothetical protein